MLEKEVKLATHGKHRAMLTYGVVLHHGNVQPHTAAVTAETI
jgi:hypothetical protein